MHDAVEFKEAEHPRAPDGKFGSKGAAAMPKGMEHLTKGEHKTVSSYCGALLHEGKYSNQQIAQAAQAQFGGKTSAASVAWYKMEAKKSSAGKAVVAKLKTGIKSNDTAIKAAAVSPVPLEKLSAAIDAQAEKSCKTVFVFAYDAHSKKVLVKLSGVPDGLDKQEWVGQALSKKGLTASVVAPWDASKPAPPNVTDITLSNAEATTLKDAAYAKAQVEAKAKQPVTEAREPDEQLSPAIVKSIKGYTDGEYSSLNRLLRQGQPLSSTQATLAANLDKAIAKHRMAQTTTVYRGIREPVKFFGPTVTLGTVVIDNGFISTSKESSTAARFLGLNRSGLVAKITMQKGASAIDVSTLSLHDDESEVLLPRGSMFKVVAINGKEVELEHVQY